MQETNDQFIVQVLHKKPIVIQKFDTPLQIAHKFCCENGIELRHCRTISQSVVGLMKTYIHEYPTLKLFQKYFGNQTALPKKQYYTIDDILNIDQENQQKQQKFDVYRSPQYIDMSKKLYQNILSPPPEEPQSTILRQKTINHSPISTKKLSFKQRIAYKIFNQLDHDKDGYISPSQIDISQLPDDILKHLIGVLLTIDHDKLTLNAYQFSTLFEQHYDKLNSIQKQRFLSIK